MQLQLLLYLLLVESILTGKVGCIQLLHYITLTALNVVVTFCFEQLHGYLYIYVNMCVFLLYSYRIT